VSPVQRDNGADGDGYAASSAHKDIEYRFYCEFQSHEPEFDYLKSLEIEEKINRIRWRRHRAGPLFILSTNDKTIKFWKVYEKKVRIVSSRNVEVRNGHNPFVAQLRMPTLHPVQSIATAALKRTFSNGHTCARRRSRGPTLRPCALHAAPLRSAERGRLFLPLVGVPAATTSIRSRSARTERPSSLLTTCE
jgi:hypothetical protein